MTFGDPELFHRPHWQVTSRMSKVRMGKTMAEALHFDDVNVGDSWKSGSRTVTETDIVMFASMTGDFNPLHVDHEFAKETRYKKPLAHGLLGVAWVAGLGSFAPHMQTEAFVAIREWKFLHPCYAGDTVHIATTVVEKIDKGSRRRGTVLWNRQLVHHDGRVLQEGIFESLVSKRSKKKA